MKRLSLIALTLALVACSKGSKAPAAGSGAAPQTEDEKTFYALGLILGRNLQQFSMSPAELEFVKTGMADQVNNKTTTIKIEEYGPKVQALARSRATAKAETEKKSGQEFADKAAAEAGAQKLPSGLVYKSIKEGEGPNPQPTDKVKVHYHGTLTNGTVFDSSVDRKQPAEFNLNQVIPCWTEGVQKMKVGGKAKLVCPATIAYGEQGRPGIPGGATLNFEVELLSIEAGGPQGMPPGMSLPPGHPPAGGAPPPKPTKMPPQKKL